MKPEYSCSDSNWLQFHKIAVTPMYTWHNFNAIAFKLLSGTIYKCCFDGLVNWNKIDRSMIYKITMVIASCGNIYDDKYLVGTYDS